MGILSLFLSSVLHFLHSSFLSLELYMYIVPGNKFVGKAYDYNLSNSNFKGANKQNSMIQCDGKRTPENGIHNVLIMCMCGACMCSETAQFLKQSHLECMIQCDIIEKFVFMPEY